MGILNVTPDSFSDGGQFVTQDTILDQTEIMIESGADIIDIGGESTRPFAEPVSETDELARVIPAIQAIRSRHTIPISIDTTKAHVAAKALEAGADIINDISAFRFDPGMADVAKEHSVPVIIMHMQGTPGDMQVDPIYDNVIEETIDFFQERVAWLEENGIARTQVIIDPGIGFGKTLTHNLTIISNIEKYLSLKCPVLVGHSRKSFIEKVLGNEVDDRDNATAILSGFLAQKGVSILRVHNVKANFEALRLIQALYSS